MVRAIPFGNLQKIWSVVCDDVIFLLFLVCSADLDILCSGLSSYHAKFYSFYVYTQNFHPWFVEMLSVPYFRALFVT